MAAARGKLHAFLSAYWLRPENAFWMVLRSDALDACRLEAPWIDLSCGDGVFSFLHAGGRFDDAFDVFTSVAHLDRVKTSHADIFDHVDEAYRPGIVRRPSSTIACGSDWKAALLEKAGRLALYDRLIEHDNNRPLPVPDGAFQTVYCNAIYWVERIDAFLAEIRRICAPAGRVILEVKLDSILSCTLERFRSGLGDEFLSIINRGRFATWPSMSDRVTWERRFEQAGLRTVRAIPFATRTHAHVWDVGLRPIAPLLARMANALTPATRLSIKRDWIALFEDLAKPFCDPTLRLADSTTEEEVEVLFELRPR